MSCAILVSPFAVMMKCLEASWLKVGQSYVDASEREQQVLTTGVPASGAGPPVQRGDAGEARPKAADFFDDGNTNSTTPKRSKDSIALEGRPLNSESAESSRSAGEGRSERGAHYIRTNRRKRGHGQSRRSGGAVLSSCEDTDSSSNVSSRHREKGRKRGRDDRESRDHQMNNGSKRKSKPKQRQRSTLRRRRRSRSASDGNSSARDNREALRQSTVPDLPLEDVFVVDRRGDPDNLTFGGFYRLDVPLYNSLHDRGRKARLPRNGESTKAARYFGSQAQTLNSDGHLTRMQLWKGDKRRDQALKWEKFSEAIADDTVRRASVGDSRDTISSANTWNTDSERQREGPEFLPVDPAVTLPDATDVVAASDAREHGNDDKIFMESLEQWVTRKTMEFNRMTRERPDSEHLWLAFADFQEEAVRALQGGGFRSQTPSDAILRVVLEKQASVLDGAVRRNPASVTLKIAQLQLAEQLKNHEVADLLWKTALEKSADSCAMWLRYLKFKAGNFTSFSMMDHRSSYTRSIRALVAQRKAVQEANEKEEQATRVFLMGRSMLDDCKQTAHAEANMLDVLWSYCVSERAAGYNERALGTLQAMTELNIRPHGSTVSIDEVGRFWDSEAPRIGDAHPAQAGFTRWLGSRAISNVKLERGPQKTKMPRPLQDKRSVNLKPKRKRAVDFFTGELSAADQAHARAGNAPPSNRGDAGDNDVQGQREQEPGPTEYAHVLENAYRAAVDMSASAQPSIGPQENRLDDWGSNFSGSESSEIVAVSTREKSTIASKEAVNSTGDMKGKPKDPPPGVDPGPVVQGEARAVDAEGLIWVDETHGTAYSVRHGYRIDVQDALDSVSGLEYKRILNQMTRGNDGEEHKEQIAGGAAMSASKRHLRRGFARKRDGELMREAAMLQDVSPGDRFSSWAEVEDTKTKREWHPIRATENPEGAEDQPDRVVFTEDLKPFIFSLGQPSSLRALVGMFLSIGGLVFPRSSCSHSTQRRSEASRVASFGEGSSTVGLLVAVEDGLQAVWNASGGDLLASGQGVTACIRRKGSCLPALTVSSAADQFMLLTDQVIGDRSRQTFLRNALHHLVRAPESLPAESARDTSSASVLGSGTEGDTLVQLQCSLMMFEGWLVSDVVNREAGSEMTDDYAIRRHDARKVAKSLLEASQASATDLRLWCSYVELLILLDCREEAVKVAEKALSMVQILPEDKKPQSAELFWLTFRLRAGLPLNPRDALCSSSSKDGVVADLFRCGNGMPHGNREMALRMLCCFAEGTFTRTKSKKAKRNGKASSSDGADADAASPSRLLTARRLMAAHVARIGAELVKGTNAGTIHRLGSHFDMTLPLMYYAAAWAWLEYLTRGPACAEKVMSDSLEVAKRSVRQTEDGGATKLPSNGAVKPCLTGTIAGNRPYSWDVIPEDCPLAVCLERMNRAFCELLVLARHFDPASTGPRNVRVALLRGLQSFPCEPGMLALLLNAEKFSSSQQRLTHHLFEVSRRRALSWEQGPTAIEWILAATHQVMRCVSEARQSTMTSRFEEVKKRQHGQHLDAALCVKNWPDGSFARLTSALEAAVTHPTGRGIPLLWRIYTSLEAMRGHHTKAKQLFWRAIHACPGDKTVWMDAIRGKDKAKTGLEGLRPAFREKELDEILDSLLEKSLHLRSEPP